MRADNEFDGSCATSAQPPVGRCVTKMQQPPEIASCSTIPATRASTAALIDPDALLGRSRHTFLTGGS